jgi:hypothetical protein
MTKVEVKYKVRLDDESPNRQTPLSIIRKKTGDDLFVIESCNQYRKWTANPDLISCWIGSPDGDYHSAPDAEDMPLEFIEKWLNKWKKNWD